MITKPEVSDMRQLLSSGFMYLEQFHTLALMLKLTFWVYILEGIERFCILIFLARA